MGRLSWLRWFLAVFPVLARSGGCCGCRIHRAHELQPANQLCGHLPTRQGMCDTVLRSTCPCNWLALCMLKFWDSRCCKPAPPVLGACGLLLQGGGLVAISLRLYVWQSGSVRRHDCSVAHRRHVRAPCVAHRLSTSSITHHHPTAVCSCW
jgi:hypothetical protein